MSRLARSPRSASAQPAPSDVGTTGGSLPPPQGEKGDGPAGRIAKYIPAEAVAFYLGVKNLIEASSDVTIPTQKASGDLWINVVFVIAFVGTPIYLLRQREKGAPWIVNTVLATLAFPVWVVALRNAFGWFADFDPMTAGVVLFVYTFAAGAIKPVK